MIHIFHISGSIFGGGLGNTKQKYGKQGFFEADPPAGLTPGH